MTDAFGSPAQWRERAMETRRLAEQMHDPVSRRIMLGVADSYEEIARRAEAIAKLEQTQD